MNSLAVRGCSDHVEVAKSRLAKGYSRSAPLYDALAGQQYLIGIRRMLPFVRVPAMPAILDIGSGTGLNLFEAARWFGPARLLCGIDLSPGMVEVARTKAVQLGIPAQFTLGDAENLPYPDRTFDLVIANSVLHWFHDRQRAMREMARVLRPGGQVVVICAAAPGFSEFFTLIDQVLNALQGGAAPPSRPSLPTAAEVTNLMQNAGLLPTYLQNPMQLQRITNPEEFVRLMATIAPQWTADLPLDVAAMAERLLAALMRQGWPLGFPNTWSAVEAIGTRLL